MSELETKLSDILTKAVAEAIGDCFPLIERSAMELAQDLIREDERPIWPDYGENGATVSVSILPDSGPIDAVEITSDPLEISHLFWQYEDCWRTQANLILALDHSLAAIKQKFLDEFGFPAEREVLIRESMKQFPSHQYPRATHKFWPDK